MGVANSAQNMTRATVSEFLTDVLGSLVPGILFLTAASGTAVLLLVAVIGPTTPVGRNTLPHQGLAAALLATGSTSSMLWVFLGLLFLVTGYVVGHLFYRRDPKLPNRASFNRIASAALFRRWLEHNKREKGNLPFRLRLKEAARRLRGMVDPFAIAVRDAVGPWKDTTVLRQGKDATEFVRDVLSLPKGRKKYVKEQVDWLRGEFACDSIDDCEFPFPYMKKYLTQRNHGHLADYIDWDGPDEHRSKTAINRYKLAIEAFFPARYRRLVRNEAHVRLSASTWYAAGMLSSLIGLALVVMLLVMAVDYLDWPLFDTAGFVLPWHLELILPLVGARMVVNYLRRSVEAYNHYQRIREVFFVLEMAHICGIRPIGTVGDERS